jgi:cytochrome c oxidase subunit II
MFWLVQQAAAKSFMPVAGSKIAEHVDQLYAFLVWASLISCVLVIGGMMLFAYKYRRKSDNDKTAYIEHNITLEFLWSFIPFVIFMIVFGWGWWVYHDMRSMPKNAFEIHVVGQKWYWDFQYKSGRKTSGEFYAPLGEPVKLIMSSRDVIHSFYIPGMRIKQDVVPGRYSALWFQAEKPGTYQVFCTEYCGDGHSAMLAKVHVMPRKDFDSWLQNDPYKGLSVAQVGEKVFAAKCVACHNVTAEKKVGPGFAGLFGKEREFESGEKLVVDENYLRESILVPGAKIVKGYPNAMTVFQGQISEEELRGVIEYIKGLK